MSNDDVDIKIIMRNLLSAPVGEAEKSLSSLNHKLVESATDLKLVQHEMDKTGTKAEEMGVKARIGGKGVKQVGDDADKTTAKLTLLDMRMKKMSGKGGGLFSFIEFGHLFKAMKWGTLIGVVSNLLGVAAQMLTSVGAGAYAAISGLAPLSGMMVAFPAILGSFVQGMGYAKIATFGLQKAITDLLTPNMNPTQLAIDMSRLSPAGAEFAKTVVTLRTPIHALALDLQQQLMPSMTGLLKLFKNEYVGIFGKGMKQTGSSIVGVIGHLKSFLQLSSTKTKVSGLLSQNANFLGSIGHAGVSLFSTFLNVMTAAAPMLQELATSMTIFFTTMDVNSGKNKNGLTKFFNSSLKVAKEVYHWTKNIFGGLMGMGKASLGLSHALGTSFLGSAEKFNKWANSIAGQKTLVKFFNDMKAPLYATGHLLSAIGSAFLKIGTNKSFTNTINAVSDKLLPAIVSLMDSINSTDFISGFATFLVGIAEFAKKTHLFGTIGTIFTIIGNTFGLLGKIMEHLPDRLAKFVGLLLSIGLFALKWERLGNVIKWIYSALKSKTIDIAFKSPGLQKIVDGINKINSFENAPKTLAKTVTKTQEDQINSKFGAGRGLAANDANAAAYIKKLGASTELSTLGKVGMGFSKLLGGVGILLMLKNLKSTLGIAPTAGYNPFSEKNYIANKNYAKTNNGFINSEARNIQQLFGNLIHPSRVFGNNSKTTAGDITSKTLNSPIIKVDKMQVKTLVPTGVPKFAGGSISAGTKYTVGELGQEAFISRSGKMSMIGVRGQEDRVFSESGTIIPNHLLASIDASNNYSASMARSMASGMKTSSPTRSGGEMVHRSYNFGDINISQATPFDVKREIKQAIAEADRDRRERG